MLAQLCGVLDASHTLAAESRRSSNRPFRSVEIPIANTGKCEEVHGWIRFRLLHQPNLPGHSHGQECWRWWSDQPICFKPACQVPDSNTTPSEESYGIFLDLHGLDSDRRTRRGGSLRHCCVSTMDRFIHQQLRPDQLQVPRDSNIP